jgi:hypothetical protein
MIDAKQIATMAAFLVDRIVQSAVELIAPGRLVEDLSPEETEATIAVLLATTAALQSYVVAVLPHEKACNVRAYLDRLAHDMIAARAAPPTPPQVPPCPISPQL